MASADDCIFNCIFISSESFELIVQVIIFIKWTFSIL
jgi:hypothetical protein